RAPSLGFDYLADRSQRLPRVSAEPRVDGGVQHEANRLILDKYAPPAVIVDHDLQIVQFRGQTGKYLEPAPGGASLNVLKMAREGLLYGLRTALHSARQHGKMVRKEGLRVKSNGGHRDVNIEVVPLNSEQRHYLIVFEDVTVDSARTAASKNQEKKKKPA